MPRQYFDYKTCLEIICYVALLFLMVPIRIEKSKNDEFLAYIEEFNKTYPNQTTYNMRLIYFQRSLNNIEKMNINRLNWSALYGLTKFSDMTENEFLNFQQNNSTQFQIATQSTSYKTKRTVSWADLPKVVDWRNEGVVTEVKNQKECGACWAFAVTETIESMQSIKSSKLIELSVQQMIDCSTYNNGCNGGDMCVLLRWMQLYNISVSQETNYPLKLVDQTCQKINSKIGVKIKNSSCDNFVGREDIILQLLATHGPVAVAVRGQSWQNYVNGIIDNAHCNGQLTTHAVQIVGYNLTGEVPYYIVRNSWGVDFGDNGYLYVKIGGNVCGLAEEVVTVTV